jgi:hypothetical protein
MTKSTLPTKRDVEVRYREPHHTWVRGACEKHRSLSLKRRPGFICHWAKTTKMGGNKSFLRKMKSKQRWSPPSLQNKKPTRGNVSDAHEPACAHMHMWDPSHSINIEGSPAI